jgi:nitrogenase molybdenum-iron protein alpha/beta subunit
MQSRKPDISFLKGVLLALDGVKNSMLITKNGMKSDLEAQLQEEPGHNLRKRYLNNELVFFLKKNSKKGQYTIIKEWLFTHSHIELLVIYRADGLMENEIEKLKRESKIIIMAVNEHAGADWLAGYEKILFELAQEIPLKKKVLKPKTVAIVGNFAVGNYGEQAGNIIELRRLLKAMSLELISIWLGSGKFNELQKIQAAEVIISMPYGRAAARAIAKRTGAKLIETDIPFGINNTIIWLKKIGQGMGIAKRAEKVIAIELRRTIPILEWVVSKYIENNIYSIVTDKYMAIAMLEAFREIGAELSSIFILNSAAEHIGKIKEYKDITILNVPFWQSMGKADFNKANIIVGNDYVKKYLKRKMFIDFGYPASSCRQYLPLPFLGFKGFIEFLNRITNAVSSGLVVGK